MILVELTPQEQLIKVLKARVRQLKPLLRLFSADCLSDSNFRFIVAHNEHEAISLLPLRDQNHVEIQEVDLTEVGIYAVYYGGWVARG